MINKNKPFKITVTFSLMVIMASCLCLLVQFYALPYKKSSLFSLANRMLLVIWVVVVGIVLFRRMLKPISGEMISEVLIIVCTGISWMFAAVSSPGRMVDNALRVAGFLMLPIMLGYSGYFKIDVRIKKVVYVTILLAALLFIWLYHSDLRNQFQGPYAIVQIDAVTLGYANPNQTAMYLLLCSMVLFSGVFYFNSKYLRVFCGAIGCYIAWIMLLTESRTTALLFAVFAVMAIYVRKREVPKLWVHIAFLLPVVYLLLSIALPLLEKTITFLGESIFTGREQIYDRYFQRLNIMTFAFGDMNYFLFDNMHNGYIAIAATVGILVCVSYVRLLHSFAIRNRPDGNSSVYERIAFVGFLCAIMSTCSEAALFVGGSQYAFLLFGLIILFAKPCTIVEA